MVDCHWDTIIGKTIVGITIYVYIIYFFCILNNLVGGFNPSEKILVDWDDSSYIVGFMFFDQYLNVH